jgi:hypothetical protein
MLFAQHARLLAVAAAIGLLFAPGAQYLAAVVGFASLRVVLLIILI